MKIAFLTPALEPSLGGVERHAYWLARSLASRGESVTVFTARPPTRREDEPPGLRIVQVTTPPGRSRRREARFDDAVAGNLAESGSWDVIQSFYASRIPSLLRAGGGSHAAYLRALAQHAPVGRRLWLATSPAHRRRVAEQRAIFGGTALPIIAVSERVRDELSVMVLSDTLILGRQCGMRHKK